MTLYDFWQARSTFFINNFTRTYNLPIDVYTRVLIANN